jgi:hypothetical protein
MPPLPKGVPPFLARGPTPEAAMVRELQIVAVGLVFAFLGAIVIGVI